MRRPVNRFLQILSLFASVGATTKQQFKDKIAEKKDPRSPSLSMFAEGVNPAALSMKRNKGKWRVKR